MITEDFSNNKFNLYSILFSIFILLFFSFIFSSASSELYSLTGNGWKLTFASYITLVIFSGVNYKVFLSKISETIYFPISAFFLFFSIISFFASLAPFLRPEYFPETLVLPSCNTIYLIYLFYLHKARIKNKTLTIVS